MINPLLFCPSPRDIPEVKATWEAIPFKKFIVKNRLESRAYQDGRDYFLNHKEYTHLVVCPDDLDIIRESFDQLIQDILVHDYPTLSGIANMDETMMDVFCCQPMRFFNSKLAKPVAYKEAWYSRVKPTFLPSEPIFQVGFSGFTCQFIRRDLMEKISFTGTGDPLNSGHMDYQFAKECKKLDIPLMVDQRALFYHRRKTQYHELRAWIAGSHTSDEGYTLLC